MCRLLASRGSPVPINRLLLRPQPSLIDQSYHAPMDEFHPFAPQAL